MKSLCFLVLTLFTLAAHAQDCSRSVLFKEGAEFQYRTYAAKGNFMSKKVKYFETTILSYTVKAVKDSGNIRYSYITKKGTNPENDKNKYQKEYIVTCDGKNISLPIDFYTADTVFFSNVYPGDKDKGIYSSAKYSGQLRVNLPLDLTAGKFSVTGNQTTMDMVIRSYGFEDYSENGHFGARTGISSAPKENSFTTTMDILDAKDKGSQQVTTMAGNFDCHKLAMAMELTMFGKKITGDIIFYYNEQNGLVKFEMEQMKYKSGYAELVVVKP